MRIKYISLGFKVLANVIPAKVGIQNKTQQTGYPAGVYIHANGCGNDKHKKYPMLLGYFLFMQGILRSSRKVGLLRMTLK